MSFDATLYTLLHRGAPGDLGYYQSLGAPGSAMLELGCGDGRITQTLAEAGRLVVGLDNHLGMLAQAKDRRSQLSQVLQSRLDYRFADIRDFNINTVFDYVIMPFTTVFCLDEEGRSACFKCAFNHLKPGGLFVFDTYCPEVFESTDWQDDTDFEHLTNIIDGDRYIEVFEKTVVHRSRRIAWVTYGHEIREADGASAWREYTIQHHYCSAEILSMQLKAAGFTEVKTSPGFSPSSSTSDDGRILVWGRRPEVP